MTSTIHALPGMGADARMYSARPWRGLPSFQAHDWSPCGGCQSLSEVAARLVETTGIRDGDTLIGTSLGGMVACEITKLRHIPKLFLFSSALHPSEISSLLAALSPLSGILPIESIRFSAGKLPGELADMFADADPDFVRAMVKAVFAWQGGAAPATRVFRVHGNLDLVIPLPANPDLLLKGGHLITMDNPRECADFVSANLA